MCSKLAGAVVDLDAGLNHTCAVLDDGSAWCWGQNGAGQLGNGTDWGTSHSGGMVQVAGLGDVVEVACGTTDRACARTSQGEVWCWGSFAEPTGPSPVPLQVAGIAGALQVAVGSTTACALISGGSVRCWGQNHYGQCGDGTTEDRDDPVAVPP